MAVLHFLNKPSKDNLAGVVHIDHNTSHAVEAKRFVEQYCNKENIECFTYEIGDDPPAGESKENWWREKRYSIFNEVPGNESIILAHQLDDCVEEYLMCALVRGFRATIPYQHGRCIRPFRLWRKEDIRKYADKHGVEYVEDPSNKDTRFKRNLIREKIMPYALELNPGLYNIVQRLIEDE